MSKEAVPAKGEPLPRENVPRVWTDESVESLMAQFRFMLAHEVKNMKLDLIENLGAMLARRSGLDRELHELAQRIEFIGKAQEALAVRVVAIEKAGGIQPFKPSGRGPVRSRALASPEEARTEKAPPNPPPAPEGKKRGRPKGSGFYARKRLAFEKSGTL